MTTVGVQGLMARIEDIARRRRLRWVVDGRSVKVTLPHNERAHRVTLQRNGDHYVFTSVVAASRIVKKSARAWRDLADWAWRKNSQKDLVGFAFDRHHRLLGVIEQPVETLDEEELVIYVNAVAEECDRFEYKLTGEDRE